jgi:hypothetical protein
MSLYEESNEKVDSLVAWWTKKIVLK